MGPETISNIAGYPLGIIGTYLGVAASRNWWPFNLTRREQALLGRLFGPGSAGAIIETGDRPPYNPWSPQVERPAYSNDREVEAAYLRRFLSHGNPRTAPDGKSRTLVLIGGEACNPLTRRIFGSLGISQYHSPFTVVGPRNRWYVNLHYKRFIPVDVSFAHFRQYGVVLKEREDEIKYFNSADVGL